MINPAPHIRKAFFTLLNNAVSYESAVVPVYEGEGVAGLKYQILIGETDGTESRFATKHGFESSFTQLVEVVSEQATSNATKHVDAIGDLILNLVQPSPRGVGLVSTEFQFIGLRVTSQNYIRDEGTNGSKIVRLLIRYSFTINQINL